LNDDKKTKIFNFSFGKEKSFSPRSPPNKKSTPSSDFQSVESKLWTIGVDENGATDGWMVVIDQ